MKQVCVTYSISIFKELCFRNAILIVLAVSCVMHKLYADFGHSLLGVYQLLSLAVALRSHRVCVGHKQNCHSALCSQIHDTYVYRITDLVTVWTISHKFFKASSCVMLY
jgi:hypothetical protein